MVQFVWRQNNKNKDVEMILNAEQSMVQEMMRNYSQNQLKPTAAHRDKTHEFPAQELKDSWWLCE
jgi:hypothetical protein